MHSGSEITHTTGATCSTQHMVVTIYINFFYFICANAAQNTCARVQSWQSTLQVGVEFCWLEFSYLAVTTASRYHPWECQLHSEFHLGFMYTCTPACVSIKVQNYTCQLY